MAPVIRSRLARRDLEHIGRYIAEQSLSKAVAKRFLRRVSARCRIYATQPLIGESCPEFGADVRRFPIGNYVVFYRPMRGGIQLLRVFHGARDMKRAWQEGLSEDD